MSGRRRPARIAQRLVSPDGTVLLVAAPLSTSFVAPVTHERSPGCRPRPPRLAAPAGLEIRWTGDAVIGRDYMANVQTSLDRAAVATVVLLMIVLWSSIGRSGWHCAAGDDRRSVIIARGAPGLDDPGRLGGLVAGRAVPDRDPVRHRDRLLPVPVVAVRRASRPAIRSARCGRRWPGRRRLVTSAGTIIVGLLLMGTTRFKLFSSTGPSVALGLAFRLRHRYPDARSPGALARSPPPGLRRPGRQLARLLGPVRPRAMARPLRSWLFTILAMLPLSLLGLQTHFIQDLMTEFPADASSAQDFRLVASKFEPGMLAPLTVVLEADTDLRGSEGLALIDDVSRLLAHQRGSRRCRSATQPLGSPQPL